MNLREFFTANTWWGKLICGFFGYLTGGSTGAFFGILIGNFFDRGFSSYYSNQNWYYYAEKRKTVQKTFFESTFSVMGHIAKADGRVTEQELNMARHLMDEMRLNSEQKTLAKKLFNDGKLPDFSVSQVLVTLKNICRDNRELLKLFVDIQYRAAMVDGLTEQKIKVLDTIFTLLGFSPLHKQYRFYEDFPNFNYEEQKQQREQYRQQQSSSSQQNKRYYSSGSALDHAYALLEVSPNSTKQEVKKAYRVSMSRNHPDKLIAQGLPQEMIKIANDKTQKIGKAYEMICTSKGW